MFMDDIKLFVKNKKRTGNSYTGSENIQSGHRDGIWHRITRALGEKETYKYLGILEADTIKQVEMKEKIQKEYI